MGYLGIAKRSEVMAKMHITKQSVDYAESLTRRIQVAGDELAELLTEARDGKWWAVLGYKTWNAYVEDRFDFGRRRANQLIAARKVTHELRAEVGTVVPKSTPISISERAARDIRHRVPEVIDLAREQVSAGASPQEAVSRVIADVRAPIRHVAAEDSFDDELPARDSDEPEHVHKWVCLECAVQELGEPGDGETLDAMGGQA